MGKGDKKSKRGKIILGSFGVRRRRKAKKSVVVPVKEVAARIPETVIAEAPAEVRAAKPAKTARPETDAKTAAKPATKPATKPAAKPAAKKSEKEAGAEKAARPASKAKKPAPGKED
jgi:ribosomal small subunit protein bTHX